MKRACNERSGDAGALESGEIAGMANSAGGVATVKRPDSGKRARFFGAGKGLDRTALAC